MIADLFVPEAQADPYVWSAVLLAHFAIGVCLRLFGMKPWIVAFGYAAFEVIQAAVSGAVLPVDSLLDWTAVMIGSTAKGPLSALAIACVVAAGAATRARPK